MSIAKVEPLLTTRNVSGPFDYRLPEAMSEVQVGSVLVVPFGRRRVVGVVVGLADHSDLPGDRLAEPLEALEAGVPPELVALGRWVGQEYCSTTARGLGLVLPPGVGTGAEARRVRPLVELQVEATEEGLDAIARGERLGLRQRAVLRALTAGPKLARQLAASAGSDRATLRRLEARGASAYAVDVTSPDVAGAGLHVVHVLAPELCQLDVVEGARFLGGRRLYEAGFQAGLVPRPLEPADLNPDPHPFP